MAENPFLLPQGSAPTPPPEPAVVPPRPVPTAWSLVLPDGTRVAVDGPLLLGRDPSSSATAADGRPVALVDPGKTVSKTHAVLRPQVPSEGGIRVTDLHSTNGTAITFGGVRTVLAPGGDGLAAVGAVIELGKFTLLVDAR